MDTFFVRKDAEIMKISSFLILLTTIIPLNLLHGAQGTVFNDKNQNGKKDDGEPGLPNIAVSNGKEITKTFTIKS